MLNKIILFNLLEINNFVSNELIILKLLKLHMSREDFIDIVFYKTCLKLNLFNLNYKLKNIDNIKS